MTSRIPGFYHLSPEDRLLNLGLDKEARLAYSQGGLTIDIADSMVENVISTMGLPCAVALNFIINGKDRLVPMVVEEPSVVAAVSNMAQLARPCGGFQASSNPSIMVGQVQLAHVTNGEVCAQPLRAAIPSLTAIANNVHPRLERRGGGITKMDVRQLTYDEPGHPMEDMVVLTFHLDCGDAMGANMVNTVAEQLAPHIEKATNEEVGIGILSNLADQRLSRASVCLDFSRLNSAKVTGETVAHRIAAAWRFAWADPYRAATHNKGVMNGIDAVAIATGNDWRAIEAGVHAWCCRNGQYRPITRWEVKANKLHGSFEAPLQFGIVGGSCRSHPIVQSNLKLMKLESAAELASIAAAVGLAQNLGALRALVTEGIQSGHMRMHARTIAAEAGARGAEILAVCSALARAGEFSLSRARKTLRRFRKSRNKHH
ncbi:MAG: hydroxymethylglutaryl-CoA reductase, degradative [Proteobacteria bacterium]|nr:hydroxymethylglutaryl-CoA reductase, degradative [Pseudomonadota bacterium]